jgi:glycosyltransferase involved in cell wall biosynthesis
MATAPLRVALVLPSLQQGGMERVLLRLAATLDRRRVEPVLVVLDGRGPLRDELDPGVTVVDLQVFRLREGVRALDRALMALRPDVVLGSIVHVNLVLALLRLRRRHRWGLVLRDASGPEMLADLATPRSYRAAVRLLYRRADVVVATSHVMATALIASGVPAGIVRVVPNPVDVAVLRAAAARPRRMPGPGRRLLALGRLDPVKGFDRIPPLLAALPAEDRILVLGDGPERAALEAAARDLGVADRLDLPGWEADPAPWLAGADALLLPSRYEGMPNAVLEALACGTPVIGSATVAALAELAAAGADVRTVTDDAALLAAVLAVTADPAPAPRAATLPAPFALDAAVGALIDVLSDARDRAAARA